MAMVPSSADGGGAVAPPGKKLCPHTCSCIVKYSSKERGRSALSTRGAAYWDHIKNTNIHPDCSAQCAGYPLLRATPAAQENKEPPVKKQRATFGGEMEVDWAYGSGWQGANANDGREREGGRDMEGLMMDTKSDINRWISGGSRPFVYSAAPDTIPLPLRSYTSFVESYGNEIGLVLHFQRIPQPRTLSTPLSSSPSLASPSVASLEPGSSTPSSSASPSTTESALVALSTTALSASDTSAPNGKINESATPLPTTSTSTPSSSSHLRPLSPPQTPPVQHGDTWVFVRALEQRWDVKTWAEWYNKESAKKKHKNAYYLVNVPVRNEDHAVIIKEAKRRRNG